MTPSHWNDSLRLMGRVTSTTMKQLTIRGFDPDLEEQILKLAENEGISLNQAVIRLLRRGAGLEGGRRKDVIGDRLNDLAGTWSAEEAAAFDEATAAFEAIDPELWR